MSYALEFYSLSWDALRTALSQRKPDLIQRVQDQQWDKLIESDALGTDRDDRRFSLDDVDPLFADALDEIAEAMTRKPMPGQDPPDLGDDAALVFAAFVRTLGTRIGRITHDASEVRNPELQLAFRETFLNGVAATCFGDRRLGEKLAARPMFGLFHLDFLGWGGLTQTELKELLAKYALTDAVKRDEDWKNTDGHGQEWLDALRECLRSAAEAKSDLVTLYLTTPHHYRSFGEELGDFRRDVASDD
jgi:hypothetical protein